MTSVAANKETLATPKIELIYQLFKVSDLFSSSSHSSLVIGFLFSFLSGDQMDC